MATKQIAPILLTKRDEQILQAVYAYRYVTALDIAYLLFSPKSLTHVREILAKLSGGEDFHPRAYLFRFRLPGSGNTERVYTLGSRGRDFLVNTLGLPVDWYFRPGKVKHF